MNKSFCHLFTLMPDDNKGLSSLAENTCRPVQQIARNNFISWLSSVLYSAMNLLNSCYLSLDSTAILISESL